MRTAAYVHELPAAQWFMGTLYYRGVGVQRDWMLSHYWVSLAALQGWGNAVELRNAIAERMDPADLAESRHRVQEWLAGR